jgi:hypothetical protein
MKTSKTKQHTRHVHAEYMANSFLTIFLLLLVMFISAMTLI